MKSPERTTSAAPRSSHPVSHLSGALAAGANARARRRSGFTRSDTGSKLFYEVIEEHSQEVAAPATTLLLCDGLGCDGYVWKYLQWALAPQYRLVHFHYRGHGQSSLPADFSHLSVQDFTHDALSVLDACHIDRAVFCGHSMGVQVALEAYRQAPERALGLVLICGSYGNPLRTFRGSDWLEKILPFAHAAVSRLPSLVGAVWRYVLPTELSYYLAQQVEIDGQLIRREDFFPYLEGLARMDPRMFVATVAAAGKHDARDVLTSIAIPTLILAGRRDSFTPMPLSQEMSSLIPDAELHVIEQGTHTAPIERPVEVTEIIADFLHRRVPALPPASDMGDTVA